MALNSFIVVVLFASTLTLAFSQLATVPPHPPSNKKATGTAAFTDSPNSNSACFGGKFKGTMFTGVNDKLYRNGSACGLQYKVTCVGGIGSQSNNPCRRPSHTITVTVADSCTPEPDYPGKKPEPCPTFVLSRPAFALIADLAAGVATVSYKLVNP